jgi:hypothetical protein
VVYLVVEQILFFLLALFNLLLLAGGGGVEIGNDISIRAAHNTYYCSSLLQYYCNSIVGQLTTHNYCNSFGEPQ